MGDCSPPLAAQQSLAICPLKKASSTGSKAVFLDQVLTLPLSVVTKDFDRNENDHRPGNGMFNHRSANLATT